MKERLLGFIFCAILVGFGVNLALDAIHRLFSAQLWFQTHWVIFYIAIPAALLLGLAFWMGFFRRGMSLLGNLLAILVIGGTIYTMLGAGFACWNWCF